MVSPIGGPTSKLVVHLPLSDSPPLIRSLKGTLYKPPAACMSRRFPEYTCSDKGYRKAWKSNSTNNKHEAKHTHEREQQKTMQKNAKHRSKILRKLSLGHLGWPRGPIKVRECGQDLLF